MLIVLACQVACKKVQAYFEVQNSYGLKGSCVLGVTFASYLGELRGLHRTCKICEEWGRNLFSEAFAGYQEFNAQTPRCDSR